MGEKLVLKISSVCACVCVRECVCTPVRVHACACARLCVHACACTPVRARLCVHACACNLLAVIYSVEILMAREIFREVVCMIEVTCISTAAVYNFSFFLITRLKNMDFVQNSF